jgi:hypothetical protein
MRTMMRASRVFAATATTTTPTGQPVTAAANGGSLMRRYLGGPSAANATASQLAPTMQSRAV